MWPSKPVRLKDFKLQLWIKYECHYFTSVLFLALSSTDDNKIVTTFVFFDGHADDHVLYSHTLAVEESSPHTCLLKLMNLYLLADQAKYSDVVRLVVVHAYWVSLLLFILLYFAGFSLVLLRNQFVSSSLFLAFVLAVLIISVL